MNDEDMEHTEVVDPTIRIEELEAEIAEMTDRWMRAEAELINVRNMANRKIAETRQYAMKKFSNEMIEAAEELRDGIDQLPAPVDNEPEYISRLRQGIESIERDLLKVLERNANGG